MSSLLGASLTMPGRDVGARIAGIGAAQPKGVISGAALMAPFGKSAEWLVERTGIAQVRRLGADEDLLDLTECSAVRALEDAGVDMASVDRIILATCSGSPAGDDPLSARLAARLRSAAPTSDLNAACAGFCFALAMASAMIETGEAGTVLVVGAERMSSMLDPADMGTSILFGDGAGAAVVTACPKETSGIGPPAWSSNGGRSDVLEIPEGDTCLRMAGQQVFRWAVDEVHRVAGKAIERAGLEHSEIDVFVPHQANLRIVDAIRKQLRIGHATTSDDISVSGNTSAASIPIALSKLRRAGQVHRGQRTLLTGFGAGLSIAAQVVLMP